MRHPERNFVWGSLLLLVACSSSGHSGTAEGARATTGAESPAAPAAGLGGRLFDHWASELKIEFVPDDPRTPEPDGKGGPFANGTLPDSEGKSQLNTGHDYRLKNLFGWDLRGGDGIYGAAYQKKSHVLLPDLLKNTDSRETWIARIDKGEDAIPAYGSVLNRAQIEALVDFLLAVRDGALPQPQELFTLSSDSPGHYTLNEGGDAARGQALFAQKCSQCHGADGTGFWLEKDAYSLGSYARQKAFESWLKILNGHPGSSMHAQFAGAPRAEATQGLRDLNAALCDRTRFPKGAATRADVPDGDPRCGAYLK